MLRFVAIARFHWLWGMESRLSHLVGLLVQAGLAMMEAHDLAISSLQAIALRLSPQQDLKHELDQFAKTHHLDAACILTGVGSLSQVVLRLAGQPNATTYPGPVEIVSLMGTLSRHGSHYHMAIADSMGRTLGGHVLHGCTIYTTAELVLGVLPHLCFTRQPDPQTGYWELAIASQKAAQTEV
ncbi:PPC domain-containing DNA-binding protein [Leptolyngbya sp. AN02str]|uniref:PPC domain-containing DNA-binding protein n=1 Tax=Leptolyngbya sp. AN02str TaxID=3423363 RepID=UPI003D310269